MSILLTNCLFWRRKAYRLDLAKFLGALILETFALLALATPIRASETELSVSCQSLPQNSPTGSTVRSITNTEAGKVNPRLRRVLNIDDWRREPKIPWSEPVIINDPFDGEYLAVFDRNYKDGAGVITNWSRNCIRTTVYEDIHYNSGFLGGFHYYDGFYGGVQTITLEAKTLEIKLGNQIFQLSGENGNFLVDNKLAAALRNAPPGKAIIRVTLEGSGASIVSDIGAKTVKAWQSVY